ncbi:MAG TPA: glycosyltransferase family 39 protein [Chloroflexia bacterium]|nr:glycosyltransferase family 39 protein [Chloroflexia bacterium]
MACLVFLPALAAAFSGEDFVFINFVASGNAFYKTSQALFYRPLPNLFWQLDYSLWGLHAPGYHLTNLLLHAFNSLLVYLLARRLSGSMVSALLAATLFALQPIHVEPMVWLAGRPDLLATAAFLLCLLVMLSYYRRESRNAGSYIAGLACFTLGLFCKESVIGLPALLLLLAVLYRKPRTAKSWLALGLELLPFLLAIAFFVAVRLAAIGTLGGYQGSDQNFLYVFWNASLGLWLPLLFPLHTGSAGPLLSLGLGFALLLVYAGLMLSIWRSRSGLPGRPLLIALGMMWTGILPALAIAPVSPDLEQSRILYLPSAGFCLLVALLFSRIFSTGVKAYPKLNTLTLTILLVCYVVGILVAIQPWLQAGKITSQTLAALTTSGLPLKAGDTIYYEGLPDNYKGAFIWRNGIDPATRLYTNPSISGFNHTDDVIVDYPRTDQGNIWFLRFAQKPGQDGNDYNLVPVFSYNVANPGAENPLPLPVTREDWNLADCGKNAWQWEMTVGKAECESGKGVQSGSGWQKTDLALNSPALTAPVPGKGAYLELTLYIDYDFQQPRTLSELSLTDAQGHELFRQPLDLAADGKNHLYRLFIPPLVGMQGQVQVHLNLNRYRSNIFWQKIAWVIELG